MLNLKNWLEKLDLTLVLGIALFIYVTLRAVFVPITDDEYISHTFTSAKIGGQSSRQDYQIKVGQGTTTFSIRFS